MQEALYVEIKLKDYYFFKMSLLHTELLKNRSNSIACMMLSQFEKVT